jgi:hypothetical protein
METVMSNKNRLTEAVAVPSPRLENIKNLLCRVGIVYLYPYSLKSVPEPGRVSMA